MQEKQDRLYGKVVGMSANKRTPLGDLVMHRRRELGLTQQELSQRAGMSQEWVSTLERGRIHQPRVTALRALARELRLPADELVVAVGVTQSRQVARSIVMDDDSSPELVSAVEGLHRLSPQNLRHARYMIDALISLEKSADGEHRQDDHSEITVH